MATAHVSTARQDVDDAARPGITTLHPLPPQLGRYRILSPVGSGGMAAVYAAHPIDEPERLVAVKVMLPHLARDQRVAAMFLDEARIACQVSSPHVVRSYDYGSEQGFLYLVMDFVRGVSLRELVLAARDAQELLPLPVTTAILLDAAQGLAAAHDTRGHDGTSLGIVHRDVSPHNVLVADDGQARVSDFGVAYAVDRLCRTTTGGVKGKPGYVSPEHFDSESVDQRSDVFCLGVVAWELYGGRHLFRAAHPLAQLRQVLTADIPRVDSVRPEVGSRVANVIARSLERSLAGRTPSMHAFRKELREAAESDFGVATPEEVRATLLRLCGGEIRKVVDSIDQARGRTRNSRTLQLAAVKKHAPWAVAMLGALTASLALWPHASHRSTASARESVVSTMTSRAADMEAAAPEDAGRPLPTVSAPATDEPARPAPPVRTPPRKVVRPARSLKKAVRARPQAKEPSTSQSPLLDVGAFERERKRGR